MKKHERFPEFQATLINSHLESTKNYAYERQEQLKRGFALLKDIGSQPNSLCVFSGDMNLRDFEVTV